MDMYTFHITTFYPLKSIECFQLILPVMVLAPYKGQILAPPCPLTAWNIPFLEK